MRRIILCAAVASVVLILLLGAKKDCVVLHAKWGQIVFLDESMFVEFAEPVA